jgi:hypothetical protein
MLIPTSKRLVAPSYIMMKVQSNKQVRKIEKDRLTSLGHQVLTRATIMYKKQMILLKLGQGNRIPTVGQASSPASVESIQKPT